MGCLITYLWLFSSSLKHHHYSNNVKEGCVVLEGKEYIEEVEEIHVGLCYNCLPMLNKTVQSFFSMVPL